MSSVKSVKSEIIDLGSENPAEVALVIDVSGSMNDKASSTTDGSKLQLTQAASSKFIKLMRNNKDSLGICSFSNTGRIVWGNKEDKVRYLENVSEQMNAIASVHNLSANGGTDMNEGLVKASAMFTSFDESNKAVILLSDGLDTDSEPDKKTAKNLNASKKYLYTIAIGNDADKPLLKELAGDDARYNPVVDAFVSNKVFNKIIGQLGIAYVLLNEIKEIPIDQFIGSVYPQAQADNTVPAGKTEVVIAVAWDKLDVTCAGVNTMTLLKDNEMSLNIGKVNSGSLEASNENLLVIHREDGVLIVKISNVKEGDQFGVEMEKYYDLKETIRFSVGVFA